jgi:hypothetical protein
MRDINNLENRIKNLEYYTSLNMLEQSTLNVKSYDQYGLERPQNGFIVDSFATQNVGDATSLDWKASLDMINRELRPSIIQNHISLYESLNSSLNRTGRKYEVRGDIVTLPIQSTTPLVKQLRASHYESVNPFNVYTFHGKVELNPWSDTWFEVNRRPDVIINDNGKYNALVRFNGVNWQGLALFNKANQANASISTMANYQGFLLLGGGFQLVDADTLPYLIKFSHKE